MGATARSPIIAMSKDFRKAASIGGQCNCVAAQQKAVYNWHETRHSDEDVVDIYSPEWQQRITLWHTRFVEEYGTEHVHSETLKLREAPQNLKLWSFFFEHPVAAFSLWHVCQAFYEFDKAVCGTSSEVVSTLKGWQELKLFEYLQSPDVKRRWKNELKRLDTEISYGDLSGEKLKSRMYDILDAVERLETALASLEDDIKFDYDEKKSTEWMLDTITEAFDERCVLIAKLLKRDTNEHTYDVILSGKYPCERNSYLITL